MLNFSEILEKIKEIKGFKSDSDIALALNMSPQALFNYRKRGTIPAEQILTFCLNEDISSDWLLLGRASTPPSPAVDRITRWLKEHPDDAEAILKIIEGREAMERLKKG